MTQKTQTKKDLLNGLIENAVDFLEQSINDFPANPKYSVIHFATAIELFLKARLMAEHWTLIVSRRKDPDWEKFESGDFQSISVEEALMLLKRVAGIRLNSDALKAFKNVRTHRNRIIHFHSDLKNDELCQEIAREQCRALFHLNKLLTVEWRSLFEEQFGSILSLEYNMRNHHAYLKVRFEQAASRMKELTSSGYHFVKCSSCNFDSLGEFSLKPNNVEVGTCRVCGRDACCATIACTE